MAVMVKIDTIQNGLSLIKCVVWNEFQINTISKNNGEKGKSIPIQLHFYEVIEG